MHVCGRGLCRAEVSAAFAAAPALRVLCNDVVRTMGPATPPEAFLYRGHAYYAMGQPYFALADYHAAAEAMNNVPESHSQRCLRAVARHFPREQVASFPGSSSHLHLFVLPMLQEWGAAVAGEDGGGEEEGGGACGRGLVARRAVPAQTPLFARTSSGPDAGQAACRPWLLYPLREGRCAHCARPLPERFFSCPNAKCHEEYCSRQCRTEAAALYHGAVCHNELFQAIELDLFARYTEKQQQQHLSPGQEAAYDAESALLAAQLLLLRVLATATQSQIIPSAMAEMRILTGRLRFAPRDLCESLLQLYLRLARALRVWTLISYEEMIGTLARIVANGVHRDHAIELTLPRAMLNHSCSPSLTELVADPAACPPPDNESANAESELVPMVTPQLVTTRPVEAGEALTVCYDSRVLEMNSVQVRRAVLWERYGFECHCPRCLAEASCERRLDYRHVIAV